MSVFVSRREMPISLTRRAIIEHQREARLAHDEAVLLMAFGYPTIMVVYWQCKAAFHAEMAMLYMLGSEH